MKWAEFDRLTSERGWNTDAERARQLGFSDRMLSHMRVGRANPGPRVIDALLTEFGSASYLVLFERTEDAA